jgi:2-polyprenyl-3-methyl-5-hydroxy-6-metoxy-1,4-benzoquinol methylase
MSDSRPVLLIPARDKGRGSGHLKRCLALVRALRARGDAAFMLVDAPDGPFSARAVTADFPGEADPVSLVEPAAAAAVAWRCVVFDRFRTPTEEFRAWAAAAPLVGLDEGGRARPAFDYLVDLLPGLPGKAPANLADPGLLSLPDRRRPAWPKAGRPRRILVSFGGEDPADLTVAVVRRLAAVSGIETTVILGALFPVDRIERIRRAAGPGMELLAASPVFRENLADYDLLIGQYGLTAFEAAYARLPALLVAPSDYHRRLARAAGFVGMTKRGLAGLAAWLDKWPAIAAATAGAAPEKSAANLVDAVALWSFPMGKGCPLCGAPPRPDRPALARFADRSFKRCPECGLVRQVRPAPPAVVYGADYFDSEYRAQYGRTYLEDFPQLIAMARRRLDRILPLLPSAAAARPAVLDVGCAYGPFLKAAAERGCAAYGIDPAAPAVDFVKRELGLNAAVGCFPADDPRGVFGLPGFDVITFWYVAEHFPDLGAALRAAWSCLKPGGVLALATPSFSGVSGRFGRNRFLAASPADHWTIWEPGRTAALLGRCGFRLAETVVTGHHPERFPGAAGLAPSSLRFKALAGFSRLAGLGDTFEAYAVKR